MSPASFNAQTSIPLEFLNDYRERWQRCKINAADAKAVEAFANKVLAGRKRYEAVARRAGTVPWFVIGLLHGRESDFNFRTHLHNGDPLTARTVHVPKGRPVKGAPPFDWEESAADALTYDALDTWRNWSVEGILYKAECFNGMGYRRRDTASPYLWAGSNQYSRGKFVADGRYDASTIDKQIGIATALKLMTLRGDIKLEGSA